jgi:hypothetical protein
MKIPKKVVETVEAKSIYLTAKLCDSGSYLLLNEKMETIAERDDYVPSFIPYGLGASEKHYGDYIGLLIDIETGKILNWKTPDPETVAKVFGLIENVE